MVHVLAATHTGPAIGFNLNTVAPANGTVLNVSGLDTITGYTTNVQIDLANNNETAITLSTTLLRNGDLLGLANGTTGAQGLILGTYSSTANTFTIGTSGTDSLYFYDDNGTAGAGTYRGIVLVGYVDGAGNDTGAASGLIAVAG